MKILTYEYQDSYWNFHKTEFKDINLIVGDSGSGKTRLLNSIFNLGSSVYHANIGGETTRTITLGIGKDKYEWTIVTKRIDDEIIIESEKLIKNGPVIIDRNKDGFLIPTGQTKPKKTELSLSILREEELFKPLFEGFSKIQRRRFFSDEPENNSAIIPIDERALRKIGDKKDLFELYRHSLPLNPRLFILRNYFPDIYNKIITIYQDTFSFIEKIELKFSTDIDSLNMAGRYPVLCIKEKSIDKLLRLDELSSGMQKSLLILTDLFSLPKDSIYIIDEYENSLGISAINLLPDVLFSEDLKLQIFATSHHPNIISKFPVENWYLAHRKGAEVHFEYGDKLVQRYNLSKQDKFFQLINDPYYSEGIE
jgi:predicted ATPase